MDVLPTEFGSIESIILQACGGAFQSLFNKPRALARPAGRHPELSWPVPMQVKGRESLTAREVFSVGLVKVFCKQRHDPLGGEPGCSDY